jgi:hypothetical protein
MARRGALRIFYLLYLEVPTPFIGSESFDQQWAPHVNGDLKAAIEMEVSSSQGTSQRGSYES